MSDEKKMPAYFSVNEFDSDGDLTEEGVYIHLGNSRIKVAKDLQGYKDFVSEMQEMEHEIAEVYRNI